jgi:MFS family permease
MDESSMMFMSVCVVTTQFVIITIIAAWSVRTVLYTLTRNMTALVAAQILGGVGAGIFGVVSELMIADLTQGSGRFNITLGAIGTAVGIGAALSQTIAGTIAHHFSFNAAFLFLAAIAATAFSILYFFMPETREKSFLNEHL